MHIHHNPRVRQRGAVLAISLLILLVLTLIGVSSMDGSIMEEKMASNAQIATTTFQRAESAIQQTYNAQSLNPALAVKYARAGNTVTYPAANNITSSSQMNYPATAISAPLYNSSAGFVAHGIEIIGTATAGTGGIRNQNTQGYRVFPMMAAP